MGGKSTAVLQKAKASKDTVGKKIASGRLADNKKALFKKFDADGDDLLNKEEVLKYAKEHCEFEIPESNMTRIERQLFGKEGKGVSLEDFPLLKTAIGVARDE